MQEGYNPLHATSADSWSTTVDRWSDGGPAVVDRWSGGGPKALTVVGHRRPLPLTDGPAVVDWSLTCHVAYEEGSGSTCVVRRLVDRDMLQLATVVYALS
ncbi:hypothetical protein Tco_0134836 [Tanacetum coccineum]